MERIALEAEKSAEEAKKQSNSIMLASLAF